MAAAMTAAQRGHSVTIFEKSNRIGGQLNMARVIPGKEEFHGLVAWFETMAERLSLDLRLNSAASVDALTQFDEVIIATGVTPRDPEIPGQDGPNVVTYIDVLAGGAQVGKRVAVIGAGGIGFDVAEFLTHAGDSPTEVPTLWQKEWGVSDPALHRGGVAPEGPQPSAPARQVTLLQRKSERIGRRLGKTTGWIHRASLKMKQVKMLAGVSYERIDAQGVHVRVGDDLRLIESDTIVLCAGQVPERSLAEALTAKGVACHVIGGADVAAELDAKRAIDQGTRLAVTL